MSRRKSTPRKLDSARLAREVRVAARSLRPPVEMHPAVTRRLGKLRVRADKLRWRCDPSVFDFRSTKDIVGAHRFFGQEGALRALRMGLSIDGLGYNVFVCGLGGTNKILRLSEFARTVVRRSEAVVDRLYVQNFEDPRRPTLLELPTGQGARFQAEVHQTLNLLHDRLEKLPPRTWRREAADLMAPRIDRLLTRFPVASVKAWLGNWRRQLLQRIREVPIEEFEVNFLGQPVIDRRGARVVVETNPTHANLFGWIGRRGVGDQAPVPHFTEIRRGSFLEAAGGVLIVDANDLYLAPGAWTTLKNCLKHGTLEIQDGDPSAPARTGIIKPEPIPIGVKVVLVGDYHLYDYLFEVDPDFREIFKIRVDFQSEVDLTPRVLKRQFPGFVAEICRSAELRPVAPTGVAALAEYSVRQAGRRGKITAQSTLIADVLREADYWALQAGRRLISGEDVERAIAEAIDRVNFLEKKIAEMIEDGTILISLGGSRVGQVNGLAIYDVGDYAFARPSRITCETAVGHGGIVNIERESGFSGRSHDKGVQILAGYLRSCFAQSRPLSLTASVCFEQSYSGIDGDSASATEVYAILSSLSGLPIRQDVAVTGSVNQKGDMQPIGGVNEKIEGFFDCVRAGRATGQEGVIIPVSNVDDLMLRKDVVRAVERGKFHIFAIESVSDGIEILTGVPAGRRRKSGRYPAGCVYARVEARLEDLANSLRRYEATSEE
jgi:predicted ATP-dependent protease